MSTRQKTTWRAQGEGRVGAASGRPRRALPLHPAATRRGVPEHRLAALCQSPAASGQHRRRQWRPGDRRGRQTRRGTLPCALNLAVRPLRVQGRPAATTRSSAAPGMRSSSTQPAAWAWGAGTGGAARAAVKVPRAGRGARTALRTSAAGCANAANSRGSSSGCSAAAAASGGMRRSARVSALTAACAAPVSAQRRGLACAHAAGLRQEHPPMHMHAVTCSRPASSGGAGSSAKRPESAAAQVAAAAAAHAGQPAGSAAAQAEPHGRRRRPAARLGGLGAGVSGVAVRGQARQQARQAGRRGRVRGRRLQRRARRERHLRGAARGRAPLPGVRLLGACARARAPPGVPCPRHPAHRVWRG